MYDYPPFHNLYDIDILSGGVKNRTNFSLLSIVHLSKVKNQQLGQGLMRRVSDDSDRRLECVHRVCSNNNTAFSGIEFD